MSFALSFITEFSQHHRHTFSTQPARDDALTHPPPRPTAPHVSEQQTCLNYYFTYFVINNYIGVFNGSSSLIKNSFRPGFNQSGKLWNALRPTEPGECSSSDVRTCRSSRVEVGQFELFQTRCELQKPIDKCGQFRFRSRQCREHGQIRSDDPFLAGRSQIVTEPKLPQMQNLTENERVGQSGELRRKFYTFSYTNSLTIANIPLFHRDLYTSFGYQSFTLTSDPFDMTFAINH